MKRKTQNKRKLIFLKSWIEHPGCPWVNNTATTTQMHNYSYSYACLTWESIKVMNSII